MKKDIHPKYNQAVVTCSCGNTFKVGSVVTEIHTELCSQCHPFYTGTQKLVDTAGRVEKFRLRSKKAVDKKEAARKLKEKREMNVIDMPVGEMKDVVTEQPLADVPAAATKKHAVKLKESSR